jgi:hypothetical protein
MSVSTYKVVCVVYRSGMMFRQSRSSTGTRMLGGVSTAVPPLTFLHASAAALTMKSLTDSLPLPASEALMSSRADSRLSICV